MTEETTPKMPPAELPEVKRKPIELNVAIELSPESWSSGYHDDDGDWISTGSASLEQAIIQQAAATLVDRIGNKGLEAMRRDADDLLKIQLSELARPRIEQILAEGIGGSEWTDEKPKTVEMLAFEWATQKTDRYHRHEGSTTLHAIAKQVAEAELKKAAGEFRKAIEQAKEKLQADFARQLGEIAFKAMRG